MGHHKAAYIHGEIGMAAGSWNLSNAFTQSTVSSQISLHALGIGDSKRSTSSSPSGPAISTPAETIQTLGKCPASQLSPSQYALPIHGNTHKPITDTKKVKKSRMIDARYPERPVLVNCLILANPSSIRKEVNDNRGIFYTPDSNEALQIRDVPITSHDCQERRKEAAIRLLYFLRNEQPSVSLAFPPVGWQRTVVQPWQITTVWAWEKTVVMVKQPGHLTSMKKDRGAGTRVCQDGVRIGPPRDIRFLPARISYLELVLARLGGGVGVEKINGENLERSKLSACPSLSIDPVYHERFNPRAAGRSQHLA